jgi:hypothetical protein
VRKVPKEQQGLRDHRVLKVSLAQRDLPGHKVIQDLKAPRAQQVRKAQRARRVHKVRRELKD